MDISVREMIDQMIARAEKQKRDTSRREIRKKSPYSDCINEFISSVPELEIYKSQGLTEAFVTRSTLVRHIDPQFVDPKTGKTNLERMKKGDPPIDRITGNVIELHHISQRFDGPFAELPRNIHTGTAYNSTLHTDMSVSSWRQDKNKEKKFQKEKAEYWTKRAKEFV